MNWFTDLFKPKKPQEDQSSHEAQVNVGEPINMDELSEVAREEVERLMKAAQEPGLTLQEINNPNQTIDAVIEQDRRSREYYASKRDWSEKGRGQKREPGEEDLSGKSTEELREVLRRIEAQREWNAREEELKNQKRWGKEAGQPIGGSTEKKPETKQEVQEQEKEYRREGKEGRRGRRAA